MNFLNLARFRFMPCLLCTCMVLTGLNAGPLFTGTGFNNPLKLRVGKGTPTPVNGVRTLVIDAGHGGKDPGGSGPNCQEKDIVLNVARLFSIGVRTNFPGVQVIMTRSDDTFLPLHERAAIANDARADLFVSIHANVIVGKPGTAGTETFVMGTHVEEANLRVAKRENGVVRFEDNVENNYGYDPNSPEGHIILSNFQHAHMDRSIEFADLLERQYAARGRKSRGVKQAGFAVLKRTGMPAVLTEIGFMTNSAEERYLMSTTGQAELADALLAAFGAYHERMGGSPPTVIHSDRPAARQWTAKGVAPTAIQYVGSGAKLPAAPVPAVTTAVRPGGATLTPRVRPVPIQVYQPAPYSAQNTVVPGGYGATRAYSNSLRPVPVPLDTGRNPPPTTWKNADTKENRKKIQKINFRTIPESELTYIVQVLVSRHRYSPTDARWAKLPYPLTVKSKGSNYAYQCVFPTAAQTREARKAIRAAGYETHLIVLRRGERLPPGTVKYLLKNR